MKNIYPFTISQMMFHVNIICTSPQRSKNFDVIRVGEQKRKEKKIKVNKNNKKNKRIDYKPKNLKPNQEEISHKFNTY